VESRREGGARECASEDFTNPRCQYIFITLMLYIEMMRYDQNIPEKDKSKSMNLHTLSGKYVFDPSVAASITGKTAHESECVDIFDRENIIQITQQPQIDFWQLNNQLKNLNLQIEKLTVAIEQLSVTINSPIQQFLIEEIEIDRARELVVDYLKKNKIASLSELAETLKIDLRMLCDIIGELQEKGLIREKEEE